MNANQPAPFRRLPLLLCLAAVVTALGLVWGCLSAISRTDPWYRNTDMNAYNVIDALGINSNIAPKVLDQPGVPLKYSMAVEYRALHQLGQLPAWNLQGFDASPGPLQEFPTLVRIARIHSRVMVLFTMLLGGALVYSLTRNWAAASLGVVLLGGSAGLLFHGLLTRPELLCVAFGNLAALFATTRATAARRWQSKHLWLFIAGLFIGFSALEKLPGIFYLGLCGGWCWFAALANRRNHDQSPAPQPAGFASGLLPVAGALALLGLLLSLSAFHEVLGPVAVARMRLAAVVVAALPLLTWVNPSHRGARFLVERLRECALLAGGTVAALPCMYLLLRLTMTEAGAGHFLANALRFLIHPDVVLQDLAPGSHVNQQFLKFFKETPLLFTGSVAMVIVLAALRQVPLQLKAAAGLLVATGVGLAFLMSRRYFTGQYSIFAQVPLLLAWALGLHAFQGLWLAHQPTSRRPWILALGFGVAAMLAATVYSRVEPKYTNFQDDAMLPVNAFTVTFLYDHDSHMDEYLQVMQRHYGNREQFIAALQAYLADPAHRH